MKVTKQHQGNYKIVCKDGSQWEVDSTDTGWKLYEGTIEWDGSNWVDTFPTLKATKEWLGE